MQDGLPVDRAPGFEEPYASFHQAQREGSRHEASTGGGGRIHVSQNHLPTNLDCSPDFAHFILEILENLKTVNIQNISLNDFWGTSPQNFELGDTSPVPTGGDAHAQRHHIRFEAPCSPSLY